MLKATVLIVVTVLLAGCSLSSAPPDPSPAVVEPPREEPEPVPEPEPVTCPDDAEPIDGECPEPGPSDSGGGSPPRQPEPVSQPVTLPEVSIAPAGGPITEGETAQFQVTVVPAPVMDLPVSLSATDIGNLLVTRGAMATTITAGTDSVQVSTPTKQEGGTPGKRYNHDGAIFVTVSGSEAYTVGGDSTAAILVRDHHKDPLDVNEITVSVSPTSVRYRDTLRVAFNATGTGDLRFNTVYRYMPSRRRTKITYNTTLPLVDYADNYRVTGGVDSDRFLAVYVDNIFQPDDLGFGSPSLVIVPITR